MRLRYLGTAAAEGIPGMFCVCPLCKLAREKGGREIRSRSQAVIDNRILIDFPADSFSHMTANPDIPFSQIEHLIVTHSHQDHFYPKEFVLRARIYSTPGKTQFNIYGNRSVIRSYRRNAAAMANFLGAGIRLHALGAFSPVNIAGYRITPLPANHDPRERCLIFDVRKNGKKLLYANDTGVFGKRLWQYLKNQDYDLISLECTMAKVRHYGGHLDQATLLAVQKRLFGIGAATAKTQFTATHFSHKGGLSHEDLCSLLRPHGFVVAYDGLEIDI